MIIPGYEYISKASFKGVELIFETTDVVGGRKIIKREYPDTDLQSIQDIGKRQRSYSFTGYVALVGSEEDYRSKRERIITAFESGPGTLIHPIEGVIESAYVSNYSIRDVFNSIGIGELSVEFVVDNYNGALSEEKSLAGEVLYNRKIMSGAVSNKIASGINSSIRLTGVFNSLKGKISEVSNVIGDSVSFVGKTTNNIDKLSNEISKFQNDIVKLASSPLLLGTSISNIFESINATVSTSDAAFESFRKFFKFGFLTDVELKFDTQANRVKNKNSKLINFSINSLSLSYAYENLVSKSYKTVNQIDYDINITEEQFEFLRSNADGNEDLLFSLMEVRQSTLKFLETEKQRAYKIIDVYSDCLTPRSISYTYYGDDSEASDIAKLNNNNGIILNGDVKVFAK